MPLPQKPIASPFGARTQAEAGQQPLGALVAGVGAGLEGVV
jgi:hypothetical protein